jgi:hypothetical protein
MDRHAANIVQRRCVPEHCAYLCAADMCGAPPNRSGIDADTPLSAHGDREDRRICARLDRSRYSTDRALRVVVARHQAIQRVCDREVPFVLADAALCTQLHARLDTADHSSAVEEERHAAGVVDQLTT